MPTTHHKIGPSKSKQWTECTASISYIEANAHRLPPSGSVYADEGTKAHEYGEKVLLNQLDLRTIPDDFRQPVTDYVIAVRKLMTPHSWVGIERVVPLFYNLEDPTATGTVDALIVQTQPALAVHVRDYKHGAGVLVKSEFNKQLSIYAFSAIVDLEDAGLFSFPPATPVTIHAIQPRHHEWVDEPWETTVGELREFCMNEIMPPARTIIEDGPVVFVANEDTCRFCAAKGFCPERAKALNALPSGINPLEMFDDLSAPDVTELTDQQLLSIYRNQKAIGAFIGDVEKHLFELALAGKALDGTKLVTGREGNRKWADESTADSALAALGLGLTDRYNQTLKSVVAIEKVLKEKQIDADTKALVTRTPGQPVLALATDKRPSIGSPVDVFENISNSTTEEE